MQLAVLLFVDPSVTVAPGDPAFDASLPHHQRFGAALAERGWAVTAGGVIGGAASALTLAGGSVAPGSRTSAERQLWGYYVVDAPSADALAEVCDAELWEAANGLVELRPIVELPMPAGASA